MAWFMIMAVLPGLYVASVVYLVGRGGMDALIGSALLAASVYLLHRLPRRARPEIVTCGWIIAAAAACAGAGFLWRVHPWAAILVPSAALGVLVYGRAVLARPLREVTPLKPSIVAMSIAALACVLSEHSAATIPVGAAMAIVIFGDAILCDFVDMSMDRAAGTVTIPMRLSPRGVWFVASISNGSAAVLLAIMGSGTLGVFIIVSWVIVWAIRPSHLRIAIDARLPLVALVASLA